MNYILLPQLATLSITKYIQMQAGGQIGILLNASVDSMSSLSTTPVSQPTEYFRRFTYGLAAGLELHPHRNILLGGRFNLNIAAVNKEALPGRQPSYLPTDRKQLYNNVVQLYAGFRF